MGESKDKIINRGYTEKIFSKWMALTLGLVTSVFAFLGVYDIVVGWGWTEPLPVWFWPLMAVILFVITINFLRLTIKIDSEGLTVGYGLYKSNISWDEIDDCYLDETSSFWYGGWGLRIARIGGKWRTVYNSVGGPRVVISLKDGWIEEVVISTRNPDEVMEKIEHYSSEKLKKD
jgi:hypothetical protein